MSAALIAISLTACGKDEDSGVTDSLLPASVVTAAMLEPGSLKAYDAEEIKSIMESSTDELAANAPDDDKDSASAGDKCFEAKLDRIALRPHLVRN